MNIAFPSREYDDAVAAVCHGSASEEQFRALQLLLRDPGPARDEYLFRLELHSRMASEPALYPSAAVERMPLRGCGIPDGMLDWSEPSALRRGAWTRRVAWSVAIAAGLVLMAGGWWMLGLWTPVGSKGATSHAVAMLNRVVDAEWPAGADVPRVGAPLEPGRLRLESGLAQIVFYSGARVVLQGPTDLEIISQDQASCRSGRLTVEVPAQARGFRVITPRVSVTDLGTSFGLEATDGRTAVHVFQGSVELRSGVGGVEPGLPRLREGEGAVLDGVHPLQRVAADPGAFASLFDLQARSVAAEVLRYDQWREASGRRQRDPSLLLHLDFEHGAPTGWRLPNEGPRGGAVPDAAVVGAQWTSGRWPDKRALEFKSVNDRVRLSVPGEFGALTLAAWVRVQGLDRKINSLFMCDGFDAGTIHWLIRNDGVLGLTVIGPGAGNYQIVASPAVLTLDQFGLWLHLAVVLDGREMRVVHYVNGEPVGRKPLRIAPPYRVGATELGNWNARGFPGNDPFLIRNFSGAMDEFHLFSRALDADEVHELYADGRPQPEPVAAR